ncbi:hypothetical protein KQH40_00575 [bacterium]|nr:hypothetical protein [bacterium]
MAKGLAGTKLGAKETMMDYFLSHAQQKLLRLLASRMKARGYNLASGTALAIYFSNYVYQ